MGAKNHAIVLPDADKEDTINALIGACYGSADKNAWLYQQLWLLEKLKTGFQKLLKNQNISV